MKKLEAVIDPFELDEVKEALVTLGVEGMTISEVSGSPLRADVRTFRGVQYLVEYPPAIKVELVVGDEQVAPVVEVLERASRSQPHGCDGILVLPVEQAIRIRTRELGVEPTDRGAVRSHRAA